VNEPVRDLDVVATFRRQLVGLREPPRRGQRGPAAGATIAALAALALGLALGAPDPSSDALAITRDSGVLELRIADATADPEQMTRELNDAGIRGSVRVVPVAAELTGRWVVSAELARPTRCSPPPAAAPQEETVRLDHIENAGDVLRIPVSRVRASSGSFVLVAGRRARPGERIVEPDSPAAVHRDVLAPILGSHAPRARRLPAC
jgi:hypothetical protein